MNSNDTLFDAELISGSVTNQKEMDAAFLRYPDYAKEYVAIALYRTDLRQWYEDTWSHLRKFLDRDFASKFRTESEFESRAWEFHLAAVLTERGLTLADKTWEKGPDFCVILADNQKVWIEAIACSLGDVDPVEPYPVMEPGIIYSFGGNIEDTHRPRALRITSAIATKFEKYKKYLQDSSTVSAGDALIIAVNGRAIQHHADASMLFKRAIFGQGPDVLVKRPGQEKLEGGFYKPVLTITKKKGEVTEEVPANFMEMPEFSCISAVLYCGHSAQHGSMNGYKMGDDFLFAYHVAPVVSITDGTFRFGRSLRKNPATSAITDQTQTLEIDAA